MKKCEHEWEEVYYDSHNGVHDYKCKKCGDYIQTTRPDLHGIYK
jgi:hypothetical protein